MLLLDEPTNDLDVDTLRSLEEALATFEGLNAYDSSDECVTKTPLDWLPYMCVDLVLSGVIIMVSHDRWFLNKMATDIVAFEKPGVRVCKAL